MADFLKMEKSDEKNQKLTLIINGLDTSDLFEGSFYNYSFPRFVLQNNTSGRGSKAIFVSVCKGRLKRQQLFCFLIFQII